jgi:hypothetical protein
MGFEGGAWLEVEGGFDERVIFLRKRGLGFVGLVEVSHSGF